MGIANTPVIGLDAIIALDVADGEALTSSASPLVNNAVVLEEYAFTATQNDAVIQPLQCPIRTFFWRYQISGSLEIIAA